MSLYNCRSTKSPETFVITKFDSDLNPEASYSITAHVCQCPAYRRPSCRHRDMLPVFLRHGRVDSGWMLDWDGRDEPGAWRQYVGPMELPAKEPAVEEIEGLDEDIGEGIPELAEKLNPNPVLPTVRSAPVVSTPAEPLVTPTPDPAGVKLLRRPLR